MTTENTNIRPVPNPERVKETEADRAKRLEDFLECLREASEIVKTWPEWKQNLLGRVNPNAVKVGETWGCEDCGKIMNPSEQTIYAEWVLVTPNGYEGYLRGEFTLAHMHGVVPHPAKLIPTPTQEKPCQPSSLSGHSHCIMCEVVREREAALAKVKELTAEKSLDADLQKATLKRNAELEAQWEAAQPLWKQNQEEREKLAAENAAMRRTVQRAVRYVSDSRGDIGTTSYKDGTLAIDQLQQSMTPPLPLVAKILRQHQAMEKLQADGNAEYPDWVYYPNLCLVRAVKGFKTPADAILGKGEV